MNKGPVIYPAPEYMLAKKSNEFLWVASPSDPLQMWAKKVQHWQFLEVFSMNAITPAPDHILFGLILYVV